MYTHNLLLYRLQDDGIDIEGMDSDGMEEDEEALLEAMDAEDAAAAELEDDETKNDNKENVKIEGKTLI